MVGEEIVTMQLSSRSWPLVPPIMKQNVLDAAKHVSPMVGKVCSVSYYHPAVR